MAFKHIIAGVIGATMFAGTALAGTISALGSDGQVYNVDVFTGVASTVTTVPDPSSNKDLFSPNALGVEDGVITTMTFDTSGDEDIFVDGVLEQSVATNRTSSVAAGDTEGGLFYFVDRDFTVTSVADYGRGALTVLGNLNQNDTLGDLAIAGSTGYLSFGSAQFGIFDLADVGAGFSSLATTTSRFVGLGFENSVLYGITRDADLFRWDGGSIFTKVADISGLNDDTFFTDASSAVVPLPAAGWLLLAGIGGMFTMRRRIQS